MAAAFPDWNDLRDILLITNAGSLSGAARIAQISQSTMSRRLAAIEANGQPVFLRDEMGRLSPNARGQELVAAAREMAMVYDRVKARLMDAGPPLRVACCEMMSKLFLAPALPVWSARADSAAELQVHEDVYALEPDTYDVMVAPMAAAPERSTGQLLGLYQMGLFAAPQYVAANRIRAGLDTLEGQGVIRASKVLADTESYRWLARQGGNVTMLSPNVPTMAEACAAGLGVALLPLDLAGNDSRLLPIDGPKPPPCEIWAVADAKSASDPRVAGFLKWARGHFRATRGEERAAG
ncbi:MAG: LysR family transcriptional regulator [Rhodobacteraceae bacterium]|jgi:DNA-binding transcriptional LysR family regulator|nr:LysR family transcriptional regulator [Paracoccaceae bacterium]MCZ8083619.1 LysR family transcriptional regulator [Paracoccaceae bacterium]